MAKCLNCGKEYAAKTVIQKYCCQRCKDQYYRTHVIVYPSITFQCAQCGKTVVTETDRMDKRTRFCCASCEKKFWRHPHWEHTTCNINFHSVEEYARYERRTNA